MAFSPNAGQSTRASARWAPAPRWTPAPAPPPARTCSAARSAGPGAPPRGPEQRRSACAASLSSGRSPAARGHVHGSAGPWTRHRCASRRARIAALGMSLATLAAGATGVQDAEASVSVTVLFDELVQKASAAAVVTRAEQRGLWEDGRIVTYTRVHVDRLVAGQLAGDVWVRTLGGRSGTGQIVERRRSLPGGPRSSSCGVTSIGSPGHPLVHSLPSREHRGSFRSRPGKGSRRDSRSRATSERSCPQHQGGPLQRGQRASRVTCCGTGPSKMRRARSPRCGRGCTPGSRRR
jgi:hypothetical protein